MATQNTAIEVTFSLTPKLPGYAFSYLVNGQPPKIVDEDVLIPVPIDASLLVFDLKAGEDVEDLVFLTQPFQFVENVSSADGTASRLLPYPYPPSGLVFQRNGNQQMTIVAVNTQPSRQFRFFLLVMADGKIYGDDPVLINEDPEGAI